MNTQPTRVERLKIDIDSRMLGLWAIVDDIKTWDLEHVSEFMRAAYGMGYADALKEENPGELFRQHGYKTPPARRPS